MSEGKISQIICRIFHKWKYTHYDGYWCKYHCKKCNNVWGKFKGVWPAMTTYLYKG